MQTTQSYPEDAYRALMRGINELDLQHSSVPCNLVLTGDAFPLVINSHGHILAAASVYGRGRIVVLSHETYLTLCPALVENALAWLGGGSANLSVGVQKKRQAVADNLNRSSYKVSLMDDFDKDHGVSVYVTDAYEVGAKAGELIAFMKAGGGLLIGGQAWHWASQNKNENLILEFPGNKVAGVAGIHFSAKYGKLFVSVFIFSPHSCGMDFKEDLEFLLKGISDFDIQGEGVPSGALVHGRLAFSICTTDKGEVFLAGTYYGRGRVILMTHEVFLQYKKLASFWKNACDWLDQGRRGIVGFERGVKPLPNLGLTCKTTELNQDLSVFVCKAYSNIDPERIQNFVAEGGGLLIGGHAWHWAWTHKGENPMHDFSGNKILNKMGLSLLKETITAGVYKAPDPSQVNSFHFRHLLHRLADHVLENGELTKQDEEHLKKLGADCASFLMVKAYDRFFYMEILSLLTDILKKQGISEVGHIRLICFSALIHGCVLLSSGRKDMPQNTAAHYALFNPLLLGLCHPKIQIGCQSDALHKEELWRAPYVIKRFPVTSEKMQVWNMWGGLIYLMAPCDVKVDDEEVVVQKAVSAPYYKSGECVTKPGDWSSLRQAPAPWAEMEFDNIILTVPSHIIRELERPQEVEKLWNGIMGGVADLAVIPRIFIRKERIVADVQISAGWMHAGYPIMMHSSIGAELFKPEDARTKGLWGEIHELGHNQQRSCWEFQPHTTEATCNLWSVYVHEEVLGLNRAKAHPAMTPASRKECVEKYVEGGRKLSDWKVWTALETYLELQERFGWAAFKKVFADYQDMSNCPSDNDEKMNLYAETFSKAVNMNLSGYFKAWGWPIEQATEKKLSKLPPWTDHPMAHYS
uniref:TRPM8 channel-associated factor homolog n=1 Tax=Fundulus heteroclitus TaxID=8078 RepID=A0A3Q2TGL7_FUNHE